VINLKDGSGLQKKDRHHNARVLIIESERDIASEMERIGAYPEGIRIMEKKGVFRVILLEQVSSRQAIIIKQEMLSKGGDAAVNARVASLAGGCTDILLMGTINQLRRASEGLMRQPFGLPEIAEEILEAINAQESSTGRILKLRRHALALGRKTYIMGIVNTTPDSFSDGGTHMTVDAAVEHSWRLVKEGADIIDIGGESTRPGSAPTPLADEIRRVVPVIEALGKDFPAPISVDTYKSEVAEAAIAAGAHMINDISALAMDPRLGEVVAEAGVPIVLMHMKGRPKDMQEDPHYESVVSEVAKFLRAAIARAEEYGILGENVLIDPGIGFGKTCAHNLELLRRLKELRSLGYPVLLGTSRKSFIGRTLGLPVEDRVEGTAATVALAVASGVDIVRVHDVKYMARVARMADAIVRGGSACER
jgi:dihydropteroate synthase